MPARGTAIALGWACTFLVTCASPAPSSSGASASASATAPVLGATPLTTANFSTVVPAGWHDKLADSAEVRKFTGAGAVEILVEQGPPGQLKQNVNDVTADINVVLLATPVPEDQLVPYLQSVSDHGATNLSSPQSFILDGATGSYITYERDILGTPGKSQDMIVNHGGNTFDIVLNTSRFAFTAQQPGLQAVLGAWRWVS